MSEQIANHQIPQPEDNYCQIIAEQLGKEDIAAALAMVTGTVNSGSLGRGMIFTRRGSRPVMEMALTSQVYCQRICQLCHASMVSKLVAKAIFSTISS